MSQLALELTMPRARRKQRVHANSAETRREELPSHNARTWLIVAWVEKHPGSTDREIMAGLGFTDPNAVRPRVTEAVDAGLLRECGEKKCQWTGKTVRRVERKA